MDYYQLISNWHSKSNTDDYFSKFVFEYLAFIAFLKRIKFPDANRDRTAIQWLKQDSITKEAYLNLIENNQSLKDAWQEVKSELEKNPLGNVSSNKDEVEEIKYWNCSKSQLNMQSSTERKLVKGIIYDFNDWGNMVEFWCSVRNNFFHGAKNPQDERDLILVENGYKTLQPLIELFLSNKG